ncbi:hypothetical protein CUMW_014410 [Citrus unshiu]|nr:hypothetical protein CUMW_014410 [Citrus unshiu]
MKFFRFVAAFIVPSCYVIFLPFVGCLSNDEFSKSRNHKSIQENLYKMGPQTASHIAVHGLLLWASMGFLTPVGILTIRMSNKVDSVIKARVFFYLHIILQMLSVVLATVGAIMSIRNFENSFNNNHQRLGLALYGALWLQVSIGFFKPPRGNKRRSMWYVVHWLLGTAISLVGIINIYTGLKAYHNKTSRSTTLWTILFTAQISLIAFFYLFQDKWHYLQKQGVILGHDHGQPAVDSGTTLPHVNLTDRERGKVMLPGEPCAKRNALRNLFD